MSTNLRKQSVQISSHTAEEQHEKTEYKILEQVYNAVLDHRLPPGTKLGEADLCTVFNCGRTTVRRALLLLSSQGIVDLQSNRGAFIAKPDQKEAEDVFNTRLMLEPGIVRQLAEKTPSKRLKKLKEHIALEQQARNSNNRHELIRLSGEFHVRLANATGNKVITKLMQELVTRTSLIIGLYGVSGHSICPEIEHSDILAAIKKHDRKKSERLIHNHLQHIKSELDFSESLSPKSDLGAILNS